MGRHIVVSYTWYFSCEVEKNKSAKMWLYNKNEKTQTFPNFT